MGVLSPSSVLFEESPFPMHSMYVLPPFRAKALVLRTSYPPSSSALIRRSSFFWLLEVTALTSRILPDDLDLVPLGAFTYDEGSAGWLCLTNARVFEK